MLTTQFRIPHALRNLWVNIEYTNADLKRIKPPEFGLQEALALSQRNSKLEEGDWILGKAQRIR